MSRSVTLMEIDDFVATGAKRVPFPPSLEALYQARRQTYRLKALQAGIIPSLIVYNLFLPADCYLMPRTAGIAIALHVLISAWIYLTSRILNGNPVRNFRELIAVSGPVLMAAQVIAICALNSGETASDYQYLAIMIVIYMNVNVRPDFRYAVRASGFLAVLFLLVVTCGSASLAGKLIGSFSMGAGVYSTLLANRRMERDFRHTFLRRLQDQVRRSQAEHEAGRDALTGLFNRRHLENHSERLWEQARSGSAIAAIMCDVDHFKAYNDGYGHASGDLCLKRIAAAILAELRSHEDMAIRLGGEEFLILLPDTGIAPAVMTAERIRRAIEALAIPHEGVAGTPRCVTASLGVMAGPAFFHSLPEVIAGADGALYDAKRRGRNQVWPRFIARAGSASVAVASPAHAQDVA